MRLIQGPVPLIYHVVPSMFSFFRKKPDKPRIDTHGRAGITYSFRGRSLEIQAEMICDPAGWGISASTTDWRWLPPHEAEVTDAEREEVLQHILDYFAKSGLVVEVY
jgi:hypothetical protein